MSDSTSTTETTTRRAERYDRGSLSVALTPEGFLKADATLTRAGVFTYVAPDGHVTREFRSPEEVFKADSLATLELVPITNDHPSVRVDASNVKTLAVGHVGDSVRADGSLVKAKVLITDAGAIAAIQSGKRETSCGYTCDVVAEAGEHLGVRFDSVQKNIRYNHVAIVDRGRAGPSVRLHLDAAGGAAMQTDNLGERREEIHTMSKVRVDEIEFEASDALAQAIGKLSARADALHAENEKAKAKADSLAEQLTAEKAARESAESPDRVREAVKARLGLERSAAKLLGEQKLDDLSDLDVMKAAVLKASPSAKLDDVSAEYVKARFDHAIETIGERSVADVARAAAGAGEVKSDAETARERMIARSRDAWKSNLAAARVRPEVKS